MSWHAARAYTRFVEVFFVATACVIAVWLFAAMTGQAEDGTVTVAVTSTPALERIRPKTDRARVTLTPLLHGVPLSRGHIKLQLTAPPRSMVVSTGSPSVEGTPLFVLDSELSDGPFTLQYIFPIPGLYTFDLEITSMPGAQRFLLPTCVRWYASLHIPWWCALVHSQAGKAAGQCEGASCPSCVSVSVA